MPQEPPPRKQREADRSRPNGADTHPAQGAEPDDPPASAVDGWIETEFALPVEDHLDLHAFHPRDIPELVAGYLDEAAAHGLRELRIIHGKGIGVQRERVHRALELHPRVEWFRDAPVERGHWGATIVHLRAPETMDLPPS